jgi:hypothetical protein
MADIADAPEPAFLGAEFNDFLFASIGEDASGTYLTVVSALARLDLDPWVEAANLARLPKSVATQKLSELVSRFPEIPPVRADSIKIAARLIGLLPSRIRSQIPTPTLPTRNFYSKAQTLMAPRFILPLLFIMLAVTFGTQMVIKQFHLTAKPNNIVQTIATNSIEAKLPPAHNSAVHKIVN